MLLQNYYYHLKDKISDRNKQITTLDFVHKHFIEENLGIKGMSTSSMQ